MTWSRWDFEGFARARPARLRGDLSEASKRVELWPIYFGLAAIWTLVWVYLLDSRLNFLVWSGAATGAWMGVPWHRRLLARGPRQAMRWGTYYAVSMLGLWIAVLGVVWLLRWVQQS